MIYILVLYQIKQTLPYFTMIHIVVLYQCHTIFGLEVHPLSSPKPWSTSPISSHTTQCI
ncbi:hypothetical protein LOK49_Contig2G00006 [Camellia lanceoleosa]|nr:hypothetical protein LOK49_Contig2G00006 [Camellia lanceoleosa]